jgi:hypothetical protein
MVAWNQDATSRDTLHAEFSGTAGVASFPNGAAPANGVSFVEVLRYVHGVLSGTATGENGITTWPASAAPGNAVSIAEALREMYDQSEKAVVKAAATLVNGTTAFTIAGGPILITELISVCVTANDTTASTLRWSADGTDGAATTFTGASASLASAAAGDMLICNFTAASTAPDIVTAGVGLASVKTRGIIVPAGIITTTIAIGSTTGTWTHNLRYKPLARGVTVS